jgi:hypothetical protein
LRRLSSTKRDMARRPRLSPRARVRGTPCAGCS